MNSNNKYDIFISYRRFDSKGRTSGRDIARTIKLELEKRGYKVFFDYSELKDNEFENIILPAVRNSKALLFILSEDSLVRCANEGDWVRREIYTAIETGVKIINSVFLFRFSSFRKIPLFSRFLWKRSFPDIGRHPAHTAA